jgi:single-strand DNA-binding protein
MSFAKTIVVGNLGKDPELKYLPSGRPVATFSVCANSRRKNAAGEVIEEQQWYQANVYGNSAEAVAKHLSKGDQVYVEGRLKPEMWDGKDGEKRLTLNLNTSDVQFLGKRARRDGEGGTAGAATGETAADESSELSDDDIPF